jgi:hypothetical protein
VSQSTGPRADGRRVEPAGQPVARTEKAEKQRGRGPEQPPGEVGGPKGPEPTRFGDWEKGGRCSDF